MKRIIYIHGRDYKPAQKILEQNWNKSISHGLQRDFGLEQVLKFEATPIEMAYYGEISNAFLDKHCDTYNEEEDIHDRTKSIDALSKYSASEFNKEVYSKLPFKNSLLEAIADIGSKPISLLGLGDRLIGLFAPDIKHYWNKDSDFGSEVREPLTKILSKVLENGDEVLLISHSLGTMIAYDVLWKFSYYSEYKHIRKKKLATWLTLGSPLGDAIVNKKLKGASLSGLRKYPQNIKEWINVASEDDFVAHDENIQDNFKEMNIQITDIRNYNLSVRKGISDPHHAAGYLISPQIIKIIAQFID